MYRITLSSKKLEHLTIGRVCYRCPSQNQPLPSSQHIINIFLTFLGDVKCGNLLNPVARVEGLGSGLGDSPVVFAVASHALLFVCIHVTSGHPTQCHCLLSIGHEHIGDGSTRSNFVCWLPGWPTHYCV